tara:strand:+ start:2110 stop:2964 length:855 start_codon:yes stop_codon:yes gene_type:complete
MDLNKIAKEIKEIISDYQSKNELSFIEDTHTYFIKNTKGEIVSNYPSVSTVLKSFYKPFDAESTKSFKNCEGDKEKEKSLLKEWAYSGTYASYMGSRVHFILEEYLVSLYGSYKEVRRPIFECDEEQIKTGDNMVTAGKEFIELMHKRGAVLLDTEMVLGNAELGYTGQPDKVWLMLNEKNEIGIVVTDWKSNKPKNFEVQFYTKKMLTPFEKYHDTSLGHYYVQLPLYAKLLLKMLEGTKFENISLFGAVVVLLKKEGKFQEYKVPGEVVKKVIDMNVKDYLK